jgi:hypothetical protein
MFPVQPVNGVGVIGEDGSVVVHPWGGWGWVDGAVTVHFDSVRGESLEGDGTGIGDCEVSYDSDWHGELLFVVCYKGMIGRENRDCDREERCSLTLLIDCSLFGVIQAIRIASPYILPFRRPRREVLSYSVGMPGIPISLNVPSY